MGDGYRVEAEITVRDLPNVLQIPNSSLFRHNRTWHVFVIENRLAIIRALDIGEQNQTHTEVLSGLEKGEEVILYPSDSISNYSKVVPLKTK